MHCLPVLSCHEGDENAKGFVRSGWGECFVEIKTGDLAISAGDKPNFIFPRAVRFTALAEHIFRADGFVNARVFCELFDCAVAPGAS